MCWCSIEPNAWRWKLLFLRRQMYDWTHIKNSPSLNTLATPLSSTTWHTMSFAHGAKCWVSTLCSPHVHFYLQQFVEVCDVTFLDLLHRDLRLFEMDVLVVKCLEEEEEKHRSCWWVLWTQYYHRSHTKTIPIIRHKSSVTTASHRRWSLASFSTVISSYAFACFISLPPPFLYVSKPHVNHYFTDSSFHFSHYHSSPSCSGWNKAENI